METVEPGTGGDLQAVVFRLGPEHYALGIELVHEIIRPQTVTRIPRMPRFMEGVINLRGTVVPVIDLRRRFDLEAAEADGETRIVVAEVEGVRMGMIVDAVSEVLRIPWNVVESPDAIAGLVDAEFIHGVAKLADRLVVILDMAAVFSVKERRAMSRVQQAA